LDYCGKYFSSKGFKFGITTSQPCINFTLKTKNNWSLIRIGRCSKNKSNKLHNYSSRNRITTSWYYKS